MSNLPNSQAYQSYHNLPPLAGIATLEAAARPGLSVESAVSRLKRAHFAFQQLHRIYTSHITSEPIYELKTAFSYHAYLCSEAVAAHRERVGEMREPPLGLEAIPHPALEVFFDEILAAPSTGHLLVGIYEKALPALDAALARHMADTNPLTDAPSVRLCKLARVELAEMLEYGQKAVPCLVDEAARSTMAAWCANLDSLLVQAGGLDGALPIPADAPSDPSRMSSQKPYQYDPIPKRDERFQDLYNQGVNAEEFLYTPEFPANAKALMMLYKRIREIDVPEMMASIIVQTSGKPWDYYRAMTRQMWDEARHSMMGEVGFVALGIDWTKARITFNWSMRLNTECTPLERHAVLYFIEQGLMHKTGKRYEWEVGGASGIPLVQTMQDYDWADEVLHASIGREWYIPQIGGWKEALDYGDQCWSRILSNWQTVKEQGLTEHANWWPAIYQQACESWGISPDPKVLAYDTTYAGKRADLKHVGIAGSA